MHRPFAPFLGLPTLVLTLLAPDGLRAQDQAAAVEKALDSAIRLQKEIEGLEADLEGLRSPAARMKFLLSRVGDTHAPRTKAVEKLLAKERTAGVNQAESLKRAAQYGSQRDRRTALAALIRRDAKHDGFVLTRVLKEGSRRNREHVLDVLRETGRTGPAVARLAPELSRGTVAHRRRAADALKHLGDPAALPHLEAAAAALRRPPRKNPSGPSLKPRAHSAVLHNASVLNRVHAEVA